MMFLGVADAIMQGCNLSTTMTAQPLVDHLYPIIVKIIIISDTMSDLSAFDNYFSADEDDGDKEDQSPSTTTTTTVPAAEKPCGWSGSFVGGKLFGCQLPGVPTNDYCGRPACSNKFHHCCQTEWENAQQLYAHPDDDPSDGKYESGHGTKHCMRHHRCFAVAAPAEQAAIDAKLELKRKRESDTVKKKSDLVVFAERQTLDTIVLIDQRWEGCRDDWRSCLVKAVERCEESIYGKAQDTDSTDYAERIHAWCCCCKLDEFRRL